MEPMTYRVGPRYFNEYSRMGRSASTFDARVTRKGYESATPVYGPKYMTKGQRGNKGKMTQDLIGYDAVAMTRVEYVQAPAPAVAKAAPKEVPGKGANRGAVGSLGAASSPGVAGSAQAGLVGSVNTEVQNDDNLLPYQKV
tara:strand:- start:518 stop:940 length:423 start_codon:yes stop_codon:yes gene_type:complete